MIGIARCATRRLCRRWKSAREKRLRLDPELIERIGKVAHQKNERSNGQEGGRIVQKLISDHIEHPVYQQSLEDRSRYEAAYQIDIGLKSRDAEDDLTITVDFAPADSPTSHN